MLSLKDIKDTREQLLKEVDDLFFEAVTRQLNPLLDRSRRCVFVRVRCIKEDAHENSRWRYLVNPFAGEVLYPILCVGAQARDVTEAKVYATCHKGV